MTATKKPLTTTPSAYSYFQVRPGQPGPSAQNESPGKDNEANWLPASKGPFFMDMRLNWSKEEALGGKSS